MAIHHLGLSHHLVLQLLLFLVLALLPYLATSSSPFSPEYIAAHHNIDRCTIPILDSLSSFHSYFPDQPFIIRSPGVSINHAHFAALTSPQSLLALLAPFNVTLASANTYSHARRVMSFVQYMQEVVSHPVSLQDDADETWYWFGDHDDPVPSSVVSASPAPDDLSSLLALYQLPGYVYNLTSAPARSYTALSQPASRWTARLSFGVGSAYSGTPPHFHSSVFAHLLHGRKRWFLFPPAASATPDLSLHPVIAPQLSAIQWVDGVYPELGEGVAGMVECVCEAGDVLFIPSLWLHATLNVGEAVFVSMFMHDKGERWEELERDWQARYG